ncbi:hypothetical protein [Roseateles sp.]|uniref:hypothetical protein n=1 Tax=Roseateles sp. TaxID=1971397 RepID=UPI0039EC7B18
MGTEFIRNQKAQFTRGWRKGISHIQDDWISGSTRVTRLFRAKVDGPMSLRADQSVLLRLVSDTQVVATVGVHQMASLVKPSLALVERLKSSLGVGIAKVHRVSEATRRVDLLVEG